MLRSQVLACLLAVSASVAFASPLDEAMGGVLGLEGFWGAVLVARGDAVLHAAGYGMADVDRNIPNTPEKRFRIASITKQFTAAAVLQLVEQGRLSLEDPVSRFIPGFPEGDRIRVVHLMAHTSGIPTMINSPELLERVEGFAPHGIADARALQDAQIAHIASLPLRFDPGTQWLYSNAAYYLLSVVIERASGVPYDAFLQRNVFDPLGMDDTGYDYNRHDARWAKPYVSDSFVIAEGTVRDAVWVDRRLPGGAGGLYSTVYDLHRWDLALRTGEVLTDASLAVMEEVTGALGPTGLGVFVGSEFIAGTPRRVIYHDGATMAASTRINRYVDDDILVVILSNLAGRDFSVLAHELARAVIVHDMGR